MEGIRALCRVAAVAALVVLASLATAGVATAGSPGGWLDELEPQETTPPDVATVGLSINPSPKPVGYAATLLALVTPHDATGSVSFYDDDAGIRTLLGSDTLSLHPSVVAMAGSIELPVDFPAGTYHVVAVYGGDAKYGVSESGIQELIVGPRTSTTTLGLTGPHDASGATAQPGDTLTASVLVEGDTDEGTFTLDGTVRLLVDGLEVATPGLDSDTPLSTTGWSLGTHTVRAEFTSSNDAFGNSFAETTVTIVENTVDASGVGAQYGTFYPVKDGYRDTVKLRGTRHEAIGVAIKVRSAATGKLVKSATVALGTGAYSVTWNGRNASGAMLPTGRYRVVQTLTDGDGASAQVTTEVVLSGKRLVVSTQSFVQTFPQQVDYAGDGWAGWQFTLPSATVYRKLVFAVDGRSTRPRGRFGPQDYTACGSSLVGPGCTSTSVALPGTRQWTSLAGNPSTNRNGTKARLFVWTMGGQVYLWRARVTVTYGVLK